MTYYYVLYMWEVFQGHLDPFRASDGPYVNFSQLSSILGQKWPFLGPPWVPKRPQGTDLIFVTNLTNQVGGEKICHVEKFQLSMRDDCGKI